MAKRPLKKKISIADELNDLTPPNEVVKATAEITGQEVEPKKEASVKKTKEVQIGRPVDPNKANRRKYTTMIDPDLIKRLKIDAIEKNMTAADLLEMLIVKHLSKNRK